MIVTDYGHPTSSYGSNGTCYHWPAWARAIDQRTGARVEINAQMFPGLDQHALTEKAVAILRNRGRGR